MDDVWALTVMTGILGVAIFLMSFYKEWKWKKERKEWELKDLIAESLQDWPVESALNDWFETAVSEGRAKYPLNDWFETAVSEGRAKYTLEDWLKAEIDKGSVKYTLEDWLKTALTDWQVREVLKKQIGEIVEAEVRRQLLDAKLKAA
ncbi:hypothetical protein [Candidatus Poriferisocius sp.]|uniref:hypothetical protein n=1 Tax=Candidatus Poriferisocius sp. TaxID=3101276 RepID=UPI003B018CE3